MQQTPPGETLTVFVNGEVTDAQMAQIRGAAPRATIR